MERNTVVTFFGLSIVAVLVLLYDKFTKHDYMPKWEGAMLVTRQLLAPLYLLLYRIKYSQLGTLQLLISLASFNILGIWFAVFLGAKVVSKAFLVGCFILLLSQVLLMVSSARKIFGWRLEMPGPLYNET